MKIKLSCESIKLIKILVVVCGLCWGSTLSKYILLDNNVYATFISVIIFMMYIYILKSINTNLLVKKSELWFAPFVYSFLLVILAGLYTFPIAEYNAVGDEVAYFDAFYYCVMTLTTVGYGDFHPDNYAGKILAISMSLVGTIHMIMLISMLINNLHDYKNKPLIDPD